MHKTVVINAVGLTANLIGEHTPRISAFAKAGKSTSIKPVFPAVTTTVQTTYLTGKWPSEHGIVGNGWYFRDESEVKFWKQSGALVQSPRIWSLLKKQHPDFTCANICWWYAMYCDCDFTVTPRPMYPANGLKLPDVWTHPAKLRDELQAELGQFPLFTFWGPATSIKASQWIADAAICVDKKQNPTLSLIYLPHLDYGLQRYGPKDARIAKDLIELDRVCGKLFDHYQKQDANIILLSEYGISEVNQPVHLNRILRQHGLLAIREEMGRELLDAGASEAFAVADHQLAHVYVKNPACIEVVKKLLANIPGVDRVLNSAEQNEIHLNHPRAGELVVLAKPSAWFTYYYWNDDARTPDFARTVDIHRKPGYDPAELFLDPKLTAPKLKIAWTLLKKKLGFRYLMEVIPLDATLVKGSHGVGPVDPSEGALLISSAASLVPDTAIEAIDVCNLIQRHVVSIAT